jgi:hypothetical protein
MLRENMASKEELIEFGYDGGTPGPDLLDYRYMDIEMNTWARTDKGCMSIFTLMVVSFACIIGLYIYMAIAGIG